MQKAKDITQTHTVVAARWQWLISAGSQPYTVGLHLNQMRLTPQSNMSPNGMFVYLIVRI